jgi:phospholipid N-methyltransferase
MLKENRKKLGSFYTPFHTAEYMVNKLSGFNKDSRLLEPSGGDGVFVSSILKNRILNPNQIEVWDINPKIKRNIKKLGVENIVIKDSLIETNFGNNLFNNISFTHIIGNPPYLNKQSEYIKNNKKKLRKIYSKIGANDTYAMFIYLACHLLDKNGKLCFIISDTFLTLGIHKKLRKFILQNFIIKEITLCPLNLFKSSGALVKTCIISLENIKPNKNNCISFNDCRENEIGNYKGKKYKVNQLKLLSYPDFIFDFNGKSKLIEKIQKSKKMIDFLGGGLGMHTTDNKKYLAVIDYNGTRYGKNGVKNVISINRIDNRNWKFYHKKGGNKKYYFPVEFAIKSDENSLKKYKGYKNQIPFLNKQGFLISGISSCLSARLSKKGALWESNKAMCFFSKYPQKYPNEFFIGLLNSNIYNEIAKLFNHTNSLQIRDIKKLPFFDFSKKDVKEISKLTKEIISELKENIDFDFSEKQKKINLLVGKYVE